MDEQRACLVLADGMRYEGISVGYPGNAVGEVVFNTAMTGYQEIISDPSYADQLITLTMPHVGNTGCNFEDLESSRIWASGLIVRDLTRGEKHFRLQYHVFEWLQQQKIVAISGIDTRALTHHLRDYGAMAGCISTSDESYSDVLQRARDFPSMSGINLANKVSCKHAQSWSKGRETWQLVDKNRSLQELNPQRYHVVVYDFGVKHTILRILYDKGCKVTLVPAQTNFSEVLAINPDGIVLSNGPGDPSACIQAIDATRQFIEAGIPLYGICLGFQILAIASGAHVVKMKFGHHGANHPVIAVREEKRVYITSQNHGFSVEEGSLPKELMITHRSLFDGSLQGIMHREKPAFGFQGHPEASPGPHDIESMFDLFLKNTKK
jgi:carbamoyl-phosphate synthase small subunit